MSITPRSQAVRQFKSTESCPVPHRRMTEEALKPIHYGETAKLLDATMDKLRICYDDPKSDIRQTRTPRELRRTIASETTRLYSAVQSRQDLYDTVIFLEASQQQRHRNDTSKWPSYDGTFTAGIETALNTTENIYDALSPLFPSEVLAHPKSSGISRHIASLHNRQFVAFRDTYLQQGSDGTPTVMPLADLLTTQSDEALEWVTFLTHQPDDALVPKRFVNLQGKPITLTSDITIDDLSTEPMVAVRDIELPAGSPLIGCPFTFTPEHMKAFWDIYMTERLRIDRQLRVGQEAVAYVQRIES